MVTPEEELLVLKQFLRFGETRAIVDLMSVELLATSAAPAGFSTAADVLTRGDPWWVASSCGSRGHGPAAGQPRPGRSAGAPARPLLPSAVPRSGPALKVSNCPALRFLRFLRFLRLWRRLFQEVFPVRTLRQRPSRCHQAREEGRDDPGSQPSGDQRISQNTTFQGGPTGGPDLLAPSSCPPQRSPSSSLCLLSDVSCPASLCSLASARKGRVSCDVCGKSFYDKGSSQSRARAPC